MKLPAHRAGLPGKVLSFYNVPLDPVLKGGAYGALAGQVLGGLSCSEIVHVNQSKIAQGADVAQGVYFFLKLLKRQSKGETFTFSKLCRSQCLSNAPINSEDGLSIWSEDLRL